MCIIIVHEQTPIKIITFSTVCPWIVSHHFRRYTARAAAATSINRAVGKPSVAAPSSSPPPPPPPLPTSSASLEKYLNYVLCVKMCCVSLFKNSPLSDLIREGLHEGDVVLHRLQGDGAVL